jgi:hypothetical protein
MPNGTDDLTALWSHANENARNIAHLQDSEAACQSLRLAPMIEDLRSLKEAVMAPRSGLIAKVDLMALHQQEAKNAADRARATAEAVAIQLQHDREDRIAREAVADERLQRDRRMRWIISMGLGAVGTIGGLVYYWPHH